MTTHTTPQPSFTNPYCTCAVTMNACLFNHVPMVKISPLSLPCFSLSFPQVRWRLCKEDAPIWRMGRWCSGLGDGAFSRLADIKTKLEIQRVDRCVLLNFFHVSVFICHPSKETCSNFFVSFHSHFLSLCGHFGNRFSCSVLFVRYNKI